MKYLINVDDVPEEIEAKDLKNASEKVMENIAIVEKEND